MYVKITTSLIFDARTIEGDLDVQAVFETMNNRGKPLSTLEKLKNRLIYLCERLEIEPEDKCNLRKNINTAWGNIFTQLAKNRDAVLNEDVFLSAHLSLYRKPKDYVFSEYLAERKVFEMFCNKAVNYTIDNDNNSEMERVVSYEKINDYVTSISKMAPLWYEINNSNIKLINKILTLSSSKEIKIFLVALLNKFNHKDADNETSELSLILNDVELILFRNSIPGLWVMDERVFANWAREIYNKEPDDVMETIRAEMANQKSKTASSQDMIERFRYLFSYVNGAKGFHRWSGLRYFLFEYEESLKMGYKECVDKVSLSDFWDTSIEHIMPQSDTYWQGAKDEYLNQFDENDQYQAHKILINTLGNLTILKNGKNSSLGNSKWEVKKDRFSTGSYNEIEISKSQNWDIRAIDQRGRKLLKFLVEKVGAGLNLTDEDINLILYTDPKFHYKEIETV